MLAAFATVGFFFVIVARKRRRTHDGKKQREAPNAAAEQQSLYAIQAATVKPEVAVAHSLVEVVSFQKKHSGSNGKRLKGLDVFVVDEVLTREECAEIIKYTETLGYSFWDPDPSSITARKTFRDANTIEVSDPAFATLLWERMKVFLPKEIVVEKGDETNPRWQKDLVGAWKCAGTTNPNVLFAKYDPDQHFSPHTDGYVVQDFDTRSQYSVVLYLSDVKQGGQTLFYADEQKTALVQDPKGRFQGRDDLVIGKVEPRPGRAAIFFHNIVHSSVPIGAGSNSKYIIRSDVMYVRDPPVLQSEDDRDAYRFYQQAEDLSSKGEVDEAVKYYKKSLRLSPRLAEILGM